MKFKTVFCAALAAVTLTGAASAATYSANNLGLIADSSTRTHLFDVTETGSISNVEIQVDFSTCGGSYSTATGPCNSVGFPFNNELSLTLTSAAGTAIDLVTSGTYSGSAFGAFSVLFSDTAASTVSGTPTSGTFRPIDTLADLIGENAFGQWSLSISDTIIFDPKRLDGFSLRLTSGDGSIAPVPLPAALPLMLVGLGGLAALRRRRRG